MATSKVKVFMAMAPPAAPHAKLGLQTLSAAETVAGEARPRSGIDILGLVVHALSSTNRQAGRWVEGECMTWPAQPCV
jgi:hypothetical protein